jgi:hypothetical protein
MRWLTAVLATVAILPLPLTVVLLWRAIAQTPADQTFWQVFVVTILVHGCLITAAVFAFRRDARMPGTPLEPSVLSITPDELKIERAGRDRGMDYSWEISEIADVRLCYTEPDRIFLGLKSVVAHAMSHDEFVRISVERRTGEVDDVIVRTTGRYWMDVLEARVRAYLGLAPDAKAAVS